MATHPMISTNKSDEELPEVSRALLEYMATKIRKLSYKFGDPVVPENVAYVYGQMDLFEVLKALWKRSNPNATIQQSQTLHSPGGNPGTDPGQEV